MEEILLGLIWYAALLFSLTFHEAGHAWAALRGGDPTAYWAGQVSLDPMPHVRRSPFGTVLMPLLSFAFSGFMIGWASAPYDPRWAYEHPRRAAWMALAGPAANLVLVIGAAMVIRFGILSGVFNAPASIGFTHVVASSGGELWDTIATLLSILFTLNLLLLVFNLIPVPPLDGSGVVGLFVSEDTARRIQAMMNQPQLAMFGVLIAWFLIGPIFGPIHLVAINLLYPELSYR
ncbi:MAG: site-2 protease family protein [Myxococcales bacterium]|nr:site-2 protease family protein [Myxococcales bacterium]